MSGVRLTVIYAVYCTVIVPELCQHIDVNSTVYTDSSDDSGVAFVHSVDPMLLATKCPPVSHLRTHRVPLKVDRGDRGAAFRHRERGLENICNKLWIWRGLQLWVWLMR